MKKILFVSALMLIANIASAGIITSGTGKQLVSSTPVSMYSFSMLSQAGTVSMFLIDAENTYNARATGPIKLTITASASPYTIETGAARLGPLGLLDGIKFVYGIVIDFVSNTGCSSTNAK